MNASIHQYSDFAQEKTVQQNHQVQFQGLGRILQLERKLRHAADISEFEFLAVNETHSLIPYRQAVLWQRTGKKSGKIKAISGLVAPDLRSPFVFWLSRVLKIMPLEEIRTLTAADLPRGLAAEWQAWLPEHAIRVPLKTPKGKYLGALFLVREEQWQEHERVILELLAEIYGYTWSVFLGERWWDFKKPWFIKLLLWAFVFFCLSTPLIPVRLSVLAPAEVIPMGPKVVRAPLDGVIKDFYVSPNAPVKVGDKLFSLDDRTLRNRLLAAKKSLAVAEAEYKKTMRKAISTPGEKAHLPVLKKRVEEKYAAVVYFRELLDRTLVKADQDGIAVFSDISDWLGKPVAVGEKILTLARADKAELEIRLPVGDAINLETGTRVLLFLNVDPEYPIEATLTYASYRAEVIAEGFLAYRLKAGFAKGAAIPRIGLKGTAKIYGSRSNLFYLVMRRPIATVRQRLGI